MRNMIVESCGVTLRMVDAEIFMFYFPLLNLGPIFFHQLKDLWLNRASKNAQGVKTHAELNRCHGTSFGGCERKNSRQVVIPHSSLCSREINFRYIQHFAGFNYLTKFPSNKKLLN